MISLEEEYMGTTEIGFAPERERYCYRMSPGSLI